MFGGSISIEALMTEKRNRHSFGLQVREHLTRLRLVCEKPVLVFMASDRGVPERLYKTIVEISGPNLQTFFAKNQGWLLALSLGNRLSKTNNHNCQPETNRGLFFFLIFLLSIFSGTSHAVEVYLEATFSERVADSVSRIR